MQKNELLDLQNVLNTESGFKIIYKILDELGAFEIATNRQTNDKDFYMSIGKKEKGRWLLKNIFLANQRKYLEILNKKESE